MVPPPARSGPDPPLTMRPRTGTTITNTEINEPTELDLRLAANKAKEERLIQELQNMKVERSIRN